MVGVDEKSTELPAPGREPLAAPCGPGGKQEAQSPRQGTANLFVWVDPRAGRRGSQVRERRCTGDWADLWRDLSDARYPTAHQIVLVVDHLHTQGPHGWSERCAPAQARRLAQRFAWHDTPEQGSGLHIAAGALSVLARQGTHRRLASPQRGREEFSAGQTLRNAQSATRPWHVTTTDSRSKLRRL